MKPSRPLRGSSTVNPLTAHGRSAFLGATLPRPLLLRAPVRHASSQSRPAKPRRWISLAAVTVAAAGIGAYIRSESGPSSLNPLRFTKYRLVSKEPASSTSSIFTVKPAEPDGNGSRIYEEAWRAGVWSVMFKQPQLQIGRHYTPLPPASAEQDEDCLRFLIRRDPHGEVSRYLHGLDLGAIVELRGPQLEYKIPNTTQEVLFIAGGTGIAPSLQASHTLLHRTDGTNKPRIHILWANRRRDDCLGGVSDTADAPRKSWLSGIFARQTSSAPGDRQKDSVASPVVRELESLKSQYPGQITVDYFVDEENTFIVKRNILDFARTAQLDGDRKRLILVSGPEGFISYMAGPKVWAQGMQLQGPLQGIIGEVDLKGWSVWKL